MNSPPRAWFSHSNNWLFLGSRPITWEGWLNHFILVCLVVGVGNHFPGPLRYPLVAVIIAAFYLLCGLKMEGGAPWLRSRRNQAPASDLWRERRVETRQDAGLRHGAHRLLSR